MNKLIKYLFFSLILSFSLFAQDKRYTKGAENGYSWYEMDKPALMFNTTKETYLSSILERYRITEEVYPEISSFSCRDDIKNLSLQSSTNDILLEDVVDEIDKFYFKKDNLIIPIIFAYCYTIKKFSGVSKRELNSYRESVLNFCNE